MKTALAVAKEVLSDLVKLNLPVTAAATATAVVGYADAFGIDLSEQTTRISAGLAIFGLVVTYVKRVVERVRQ